MLNITHSILGLHGWAVIAVVFALPALESSIFLGFLFPGEIAVILGGVLAFQHRASLWAVLAAAISGAILGDTIGYAVGRRWGERLLKGALRRFIKQHHLDRSKAYLAKRGGRAVFFGRFTAALRVMVPGLAGMSGIPYGRFFVFNVAGGTVWATTFVLLGYAAGQSWREVESAARQAGLILAVVIIVVGIVVGGARWVAHHPDRVRAWWSRIRARPVIGRVAARLERPLIWLARRLHPEETLGLSLTMGLLLVVVAGGAFGAIVQAISGPSTETVVDQRVRSYFVDNRQHGLTQVMKLVTHLGASDTLVPIVIVVGLILLFVAHTWRPLLVLGSAWLGANLLSTLVKALVARPRPTGGLAVGASGFAFPSGHTTQAMATYGAMAALAAAANSSWNRKVAAWAGAVLVTAVVAISRLYLGVHWLTDVLGGISLGGLWLAVLLTTIRTVIGLYQPRTSEPTPPSGGDPNAVEEPQGTAMTSTPLM